MSQLPEVELGGWQDCADSMAPRHRQSSLAREQAQEMSCIGGGDAAQGCSTAAQHTPRAAKLPSQCVLLLEWSMQLVKGVLETTVYVGKTLLIWPPDAKLAAGRAADELYPKPWALRCVVHPTPSQFRICPSAVETLLAPSDQATSSISRGAQVARWRGQTVSWLSC